MIKMKKVINYALSIGSLLVTLFLLVITMFSWYVTNNKAEAKGITAVTASNGHNFQIQYWDSSTSKWAGTSAFDDATKNLWPGDVVYFKISLLDEADSVSVNVDVSLADISVVLDTEKVTGDESHVYYNGVSMYTVTSGAVTVDNKTLYTVTQDLEDNTKYVVGLDDYLISSGMRIDYNPTITADVPVGLSTTDISELNELEGKFVTNRAITNDSPIYFALYYADGTYTKQTINAFVDGTTYYTYSVAGSFKKVTSTATFDNTKTYYTKTANSITGIVDYFQYQMLKIGSVGIESK